MTILAITDMAGATFVAPVLNLIFDGVLAELGDGRDYSDLGVVCSVSDGHRAGWDSLRMLLNYQEVDGVILFGDTTNSVGYPNLREFCPVDIRVRQHPRPITCVKLPTALSPSWATAFLPLAVSSIKPMLIAPGPEIIRADGADRAYMAAGFEEFN